MNALQPAAARVPPEIRMEIARQATIADPIRLEGSPYPRLNRGWLRLTHVNRAWRNACISYSALWADNICAIPSKAAIKTFCKRARRIPATINVDRLLLACYMSRSAAPIDYLLKNQNTVLQNSKSIISTLARSENVAGTLNALEFRLGPQHWPQLFEHVLFDHLTHLEYHMTKNDDIPLIIDSQVEYLRLINVQTQSINEEIDDNFDLVHRHKRGWLNPPSMTFEALLEGLNYHKRASHIIIDAIILEGAPDSNREPINLPNLLRLDLRGPTPATLTRVNDLISPPSETRLHVTSTTRDFIVPREALEHAGIGQGRDSSVTIEAGRFVHWKTLSRRDFEIEHDPIYCADTRGPEITAELTGDATLLVRNGTVSRKFTGSANDEYDAFLGAPRRELVHLVVKELARMHKGERVWHMKALNFDYLDGLTSLRSVRIEDERVAAMVCSRIVSTKLSLVEIICRPEWQGNSHLATLANALETAAERTEEDLRVVFRGAKRFSDEHVVASLRESAMWELEDLRVVTDGIDSEVETDPLQSQLQWNRKHILEARNEVKILEATQVAYPWL